jgi:hypothetical protein
MILPNSPPDTTDLRKTRLIQQNVFTSREDPFVQPASVRPQ